MSVFAYIKYTDFASHQQQLGDRFLITLDRLICIKLKELFSDTNNV